MIRCLFIVSALCNSVCIPSTLAETPSPPPGPLALEDSAYLRCLSRSPIFWRPWGAGSLAEAARSEKLVFLSIGSFTCHWSTQTDRTLLAHPAVAAAINNHCLPIKVDRFERPDVERLYRRYAESTGQPASWPLQIWLTPEGLPIGVARTAIPDGAEPGEGEAEIRRMVELWENDRSALRQRAKLSLVELCDRAGARLAGRVSLDEGTLAAAQGRILGEMDFVHGGVAHMIKFPCPARIALLDRMAGRQEAGREKTGHKKADHKKVDRGKPGRGKKSPEGPTGPTAAPQRAIELTLDGMEQGGLHDHLGGGFFRYARGEGWGRPCFEKLILDQALAVESFLVGHRLTRRPEFAHVVRRTLEYVERELSHPAGGFYNGEHAQSRPAPEAPPREGAYYLWTNDQLQPFAAKQPDILMAHFDLWPVGNGSPAADADPALAGLHILLPRPPATIQGGRAHGSPVPLTPVEWEDAAERLRAALWAARLQRPRPPIDRLLITQHNAALVSAYCQAGLQLDQPDWIDRARGVAEWIEASLWDGASRLLFRSRLDRAPAHSAVADDYATLIRALLDLHEATGEGRWLKWADELQGVFDQEFWHEFSGGYFDAGRGQPDLPASLKSIEDAGGYSANAVAGANLARWAVLMDHIHRRDAAARMLDAFARPLDSGSGSVAGLLGVAHAVIHPARRLIFLGPLDHPTITAARVQIAQMPPGHWHLLHIGDETTRRWLMDRGALPPEASQWPLDKPAFVPPSRQDTPAAPRSFDALDNFLLAERYS